MEDPQLLRYSRHILLPQIGIEGQQRLLAARVLIIGVGGLGSPVAMYLAASGVGHLVLVDHDTVVVGETHTGGAKPRCAGNGHPRAA
jgi:molybdopterin/thiamine biosynthesis adenylyltransferase